MDEPRIVVQGPKCLIGFSQEMCYADDQTGNLWRKFMPRRKEIKHLISEDKYSLQIFGDDFWATGDENTPFTKWAGMVVSSDDDIPPGMKALKLTGGTYAVFIHMGRSGDFPATLKFILEDWMPRSGYEPDSSRPQYEVLGSKYINDDPASEEEVWFPVKPSSD